MLQLLEAIRADLAAHDLRFAATIDGDYITVAGGYPIIDADGKEITRFAIQIQVSSGFPVVFPVVLETGRRIPRRPDRHVNPDGSCCLGVPAEIRKHLGRTYKLSAFIRGPVHDYLVGQALTECGKAWPQGEARHGALGVIDFWLPELSASTCLEAARILNCAAKGRPPRKNARCPCGRRIRVRRCHRRAILKLLVTYEPSFLAEQAVVVGRGP